MIMNKRTCSRKVYAVLSAAGLVLLLAAAGLCYVIPPGQLLDFLVKRTPGVEGLCLDLVVNSGGGHPGSEEKRGSVWVSGLRAEEAGSGGGMREAFPAIDCLSLFTAGRRDIEGLLRECGVDLNNSSFARVGDRVAYRLGNESPGSPALFLDRKEFLPLMLVCSPSASGPAAGAEIRFDAYRRFEGGWLPGELSYRTGSGVTGAITVEGIGDRLPGCGRGEDEPLS